MKVVHPSLQVALPHSLPLPRREALQQTSSLSTVSPATVDLTLKVVCVNKKSMQWPTIDYNAMISLVNFLDTA